MAYLAHELPVTAEIVRKCLSPSLQGPTTSRPTDLSHFLVVNCQPRPRGAVALRAVLRKRRALSTLEGDWNHERIYAPGCLHGHPGTGISRPGNAVAGTGHLAA